MPNTITHYNAHTNSYREYIIIFGDESNKRGFEYQRLHLSSAYYPSDIILRDGKRLETPELEIELPEGTKEFLFEVNGNKITRVSYTLKNSHTSHLQENFEQELVDLLAA